MSDRAPRRGFKDTCLLAIDAFLLIGGIASLVITQVYAAKAGESLLQTACYIVGTLSASLNILWGGYSLLIDLLGRFEEFLHPLVDLWGSYLLALLSGAAFTLSAISFASSDREPQNWASFFLDLSLLLCDHLITIFRRAPRAQRHIEGGNHDDDNDNDADNAQVRAQSHIEEGNRDDDDDYIADDNVGGIALPVIADTMLPPSSFYNFDDLFAPSSPSSA
jgi:hypothetical protein